MSNCPSAFWLMVQNTLPNPLSVTFSQCLPRHQPLQRQRRLSLLLLSLSFTILHLLGAPLATGCPPAHGISCYFYMDQLVEATFHTFWGDASLLAMCHTSHSHSDTVRWLTMFYGLGPGKWLTMFYGPSPGNTVVNKPNEQSTFWAFLVLFLFSLIPIFL